jgi:hypothetical protein
MSDEYVSNRPVYHLFFLTTLRERQLDRSARVQALVNGSAFLEAHPDQPMCSAKHTRFYWRTWPRCRNNAI